MATVYDRRTDCPVRPLTAGTQAHFFGYYYESQWSPDCRRLLAHRAPPVARMPEPGETAEIGVIDAATLAWRPLATTRAWNWQTGSHLQWLDARRCIHNDHHQGTFRAVIRDLDGDGERWLPRAVCAASLSGGVAAAIDFARLAAARPVLGYASEAAVDLTRVPDDDGLWLIDLADGASRLALSLADCVALAQGPDYDHATAPPAYAGRPGYEQPSTGHRLGGALFSPSGRLVLVSHHWPRREPLELPHFQRHVWDRKILYDRLSGERWLLGPDGFYSHQVWLDEDTLLMWGEVAGAIALWRLDVRGRREPQRVLPELVGADPHASVSPDGRWLLGDGYPVAGRRPLWLCDLQCGERHHLGDFASPSPFDRGPFRCDLHPRWRPDGRAVSIDSVHEGVRQCYEVDVGAVVAP